MISCVLGGGRRHPQQKVACRQNTIPAFAYAYLNTGWHNRDNPAAVPQEEESFHPIPNSLNYVLRTSVRSTRTRVFGSMHFSLYLRYVWGPEP